MKISIMAALFLSLTFAFAEQPKKSPPKKATPAAEEPRYEGRRQNVEEDEGQDADSKRKYRHGSEELEVDPD